MERLLHIAASPRGPDSFSRALAGDALEALGKRQPGCRVETLELGQRDLPPLDRRFIDAKARWMAGQPMAEGEALAWRAVESLIREFAAADGYLFSVPMWGLGLPYPLKHYLDALIQPGLTFRLDPAGGHQGLLANRPAGLILARGDRYGRGSGREGLDFQGPHIEALLGFIGIVPSRTLVMEPTEGDPAEVEEAYRRARAEARELGRDLGEEGPGR